MDPCADAPLLVRGDPVDAWRALSRMEPAHAALSDPSRTPVCPAGGVEPDPRSGRARDFDVQEIHAGGAIRPDLDAGQGPRGCGKRHRIDPLQGPPGPRRV